jgi:hypothetical protein
MQFKSIGSSLAFASSAIQLTADTNEINLNIEPSNINHSEISGVGTITHADIDSHINNIISNPHKVTKNLVGLGNVVNTLNNYQTNANPSVTDDESKGYSVGSEWINGFSNMSFLCTTQTTNAAVWNISSVPQQYVKTWILRDEKTIGSNGGTFVSGSWNPRVLSTLHQTSGDRVTLSTTSFTIKPGKYLLIIDLPAFGVGRHQGRLLNTNTNVAVTGSTFSADHFVTQIAVVKTTIDITENTTYQVEHRCSETRTGDGYGQSSGWNKEIYSSVLITFLGM